MDTKVRLAMALASDDPFPGAEYVGNCPLKPVERQPHHTPVSSGLDGRLYTDLALLRDGRTVPPTAEFFVRTQASVWLPDVASWQVRIGDQSLAPAWFDEQRVPLGEVLLECSGNDRLAAHRMMCVATWEGVSMRTVLERCDLPRTSNYLQVTGFDDYPEPSRLNPPKLPGAVWIFPVDRMLELGAALATRMNGEPLTLDHGAPIRLLVPTWYGCTNIKWVTDIRYVPDDSPTTQHMRWFSSRTRQEGVPEFVRDYQDPLIQVSAMPVRVEHWRLNGQPMYRIVGVVWGGETPAPGLIIRCDKHGAAPIYKVHHYVPPPNSRAWGLWYHRFAPTRTGSHLLCLQTNPPSKATRLAEGYYLRAVDVPEY